MYRITIENDGVKQVLHSADPDGTQRIQSGTLTEEAGATPSLVCSISPQNACFDDLHDRRTLVTLTNTTTNENEFEGYVLQAKKQMTNTGKVYRRVTCEGFQGYLCDTVQMYHHYEETPVSQFLYALLQSHNAQSEACKQIFLGSVNVTGTLNSKTTAYRSTWGEIKENLLDRLGGEIRVRRGSDGRLYLDYLDAVTSGATSDIIIELGMNLRSISVETDTANIVTRLIPLGYQLTADTAERLTIEGAVIDGETITVPYIDDAAAIEKYGIIVGTAEFDDITVKKNLYQRGREYLAENNREKRHYAASVLDISGKGRIRCGNTYRFRNTLLGLDEYLRLLKRKVDLLKPYTPDVEIGDKSAKISGITAQNRHMINYEIPQQISETVQTSKRIASQMIINATTGYVVIRPNEILIMDTDDPETATRVWRWNQGGLGYSSSGTPGEAYDGNYETAITMDGHINGKFIAAESIVADRIHGGSLKMGGRDNLNGLIEVYNASGSVICRLDQNGTITFSTDGSGYWVSMSDGKLGGGQGSSEYVTMDATAAITDTDAGGSVTRHGLKITTAAVSFESCSHIGVNGYRGLTHNITLEPVTETLHGVAVQNAAGTGYDHIDLTYVTGVRFGLPSGQFTQLHVEKGLVTA